MHQRVLSFEPGPLGVTLQNAAVVGVIRGSQGD
eukprot:UN4792